LINLLLKLQIHIIRFRHVNC